MRKKYDLSPAVNRFSRNIRNTWQYIFLPAVVIYMLALWHYLAVKPALQPALFPYLKNIDLASFIIVIALTLLIFNLKRIYFARKFSREIIDRQLKRDSGQDESELLEKIFAVLRPKMTRVWILGLVVVVVGVGHYMLTSLAENMHIYFIIGAFSMLLNYPRSEMFEDIARYVIEEKQALGHGRLDETGDDKLIGG